MIRPSRAQQFIARRMVQAHSEIPSFNVTAKIEMSRVNELRLRLKQTAQSPVPSVTDVIVGTTARTLRAFPMEVIGTGTTTLSAKVWKSGAAEPAWQVSGPNTFAALQQPGYVGFFSYLPGTAAAFAPVTVGVDNLRVVDPAP